jgi:cytochrome b561
MATPLATPIGTYTTPIATAELRPAEPQTEDVRNDTDTTDRTGHTPSFWCAFIVVASAVLLPASIDYKGEWKGLGTYAIVVSAVSLGLGLIMLIWYMFVAVDNTMLRKKRLDLPFLGPLNIELPLAVVMAAWAIVGASILTFKGPHTIPGNGYFAAWGNAFASVAYLANVSGRSMRAIGASALRGSGSLHALMVPSIILIIAVTKEYCSDSTCLSYLNTSQYHQQSALGLCVGAISLAFILVLAPVPSQVGRLSSNAKQAVQWVHKMVSLVLLGIWIAGFIVLTFYKPFKSTGNGYFSLVLGLALAVAFALQQFPESADHAAKTLT